MTNATLAYPISILVVYGDIGPGTTLQRSGSALVEKLQGARIRGDPGALGEPMVHRRFDRIP